ncbi:MAG: COX15/CtaA family protein [Actinomycetota bacterium]
MPPAALPPRWFRRLSAANVILLGVIVVSGAAVRLTESGLGCPDWPHCNAEDFVSVGSRHEAIEQLNRLFSGAIGIPIVATIVTARRLRPRRRDLVVCGWAMLALFVANAVVGGISVQLELAWFAVLGHFLLAVALVAVALVAHKRGGEVAGPRRSLVGARTRALAATVYGLTVGVLVLGTLVTAAGPHGGDEDARRLGWPIEDVARAHAVTVEVLVAFTLLLIVVLARTRPALPGAVLNAASVALAAMVVQGGLGYVQYARGVPELLVGFHVAGAVAVFGSVHWLALALRVPAAAPTAADPAPAAPVPVTVGGRPA